MYFILRFIFIHLCAYAYVHMCECTYKTRGHWISRSCKCLMLVLKTELKSSRSTMMILITDLGLKAPAFLEVSWLVMLTYYYMDLKMDNKL